MATKWNSIRFFAEFLQIMPPSTWLKKKSILHLTESLQLLATELKMLTIEQMGQNAPIVYGRLSIR